MSEMIDMPNEIGRLDPFTESAAKGDKDGALAILDTEITRRLDQRNSTYDTHRKADQSLTDVRWYRNIIAASDEAWNAARRACGWNPEADADAEPMMQAKTMTVEDLRNGDVVRDGNVFITFREINKYDDFMFVDHKKAPTCRTREYCEIAFRRGWQIYRNNKLISGWPADKHPAAEEAARLREENAKLKAENAAWAKAANYNPKGTPLANPAARPSDLVARLDGMIKASEMLQGEQVKQELDESRVIRTFYDIAYQRSSDSNSGQSWTALRCMIRSIYANNAPLFEPYKLKKN